MCRRPGFPLPLHRDGPGPGRARAVGFRSPAPWLVSSLFALVPLPAFAEEAAELADAGVQDASPRPGFALSWTAPPDCTARPDVAALVGDTPGAAAVVITQRDARWHVTIDFLAPAPGHRSLEAGTCEEAAEAARLLLRLGARGIVPPETPPSPLVAPPPPPAPPVEAPPAPLFFSVAALAGVQVLGLPRADPRFGALAWLGSDPWNLVVELSTGLPARYSGGPVAGAAVEVHPVLDGLVAGCFAHAWPAARLAGCAELQVAWWRLRGIDVSDPRSGGSALVAVGPSVRAWFPIGRFGLLAGAALRPTLLKPRATFEGYGDALEAGTVIAALEAGIGASW